MMRCVRVAAALMLGALGCALAATAAAQTAELPRSLVGAALADPAPSAFAPAPLGVEDYSLRPVEGTPSSSPPDTLRVELLPGSLTWVRVSGVVVVPRAVMRVTVPGASAGQVRVAGHVHPLVAKDGIASAEVPVALLATLRAAIEVELVHHGVRATSRFLPTFTPRPEHRGRIMLDPSCSPHGVRVLAGTIPDDAFLHLGCRQIRTSHDGRVAATIELYALWSSDFAGATLDVEGVATPATLETLYVLRGGEPRGAITLRTGGRTLVLGYLAPPHLSAAFIGLGVGPYFYQYQDGRTDLRTILPLVTLYASYAFSADVRFVYFNASVPDAHGSIDQGLYVWFEQARFVDERVSLILLLGGNLLIYPHDNRTQVRVSVPQGFELIFRDFLAKNRNLTGGAFLYPQFEGRAYYNVWLRWGSPQLFGELNYIEWKEPHGRRSTRSRAAGVSFGTPLLRFL
jgi:hypothetical protein